MAIDAQATQQVIAGFNKMRTGIILLFISWILIAGASMGLLGALFTLNLAAMFAGALMYIILLLVALILALVGFIGFFISGVSMVANVKREYASASTLLKIGFRIGLIILILALIISIVGSLINPAIILVGLILILIGGILVFIGYIGLIILAFKLNSVEGVSLFMIAGILFIIGIFLPILGIVAWIIMYIGLGEAIYKAQRSMATIQL